MESNNEEVVKKDVTGLGNPFDLLNDPEEVVIENPPILPKQKEEEEEDTGDLNEDGDDQGTEDYDDQGAGEEQDDGDESGSGDGEEGQDPGDPDEDSTAVGLAKFWKSKGLLPEGFEESDTLTHEQVINSYKDFNEEPWKNAIRAEIELEYKSKYSEEALEAAEMFTKGTPPELLDDARAYTSMSDLKVDTETDQGLDVARQLALIYFKDEKGFSEERANSLIELDIDKGVIDDTVAEIQTYFKEKGAHIKAAEKQRALEAEAAEKQKRQQTVEKWNQMLSSGTIAGTKYTPEEMSLAKKAIFDKTELYTDEKTGKKFRISLLQKKRLELKSDPELAFRNTIDFVLGYSKDSVKDSVREDINKEIADALKIKKKTSTKADPKKTTKTQVSSPIRSRPINL